MSENQTNRIIKYKHPLMHIPLQFLTLGVYGVVYYVKSKRDMNALGADIPTSWLLLVPFANIYYLYKYAEGYTKISGGGSAIGLTIAQFIPLVYFVVPYLVQSELNKHVTEAPTPEKAKKENLEVANAA